MKVKTDELSESVAALTAHILSEEVKDILAVYCLHLFSKKKFNKKTLMADIPCEKQQQQNLITLC